MNNWWINTRSEKRWFQKADVKMLQNLDIKEIYIDPLDRIEFLYINDNNIKSFHINNWHLQYININNNPLETITTDNMYYLFIVAPIFNNINRFLGKTRLNLTNS